MCRSRSLDRDGGADGSWRFRARGPGIKGPIHSADDRSVSRLRVSPAIWAVAAIGMGLAVYLIIQGGTATPQPAAAASSVANQLSRNRPAVVADALGLRVPAQLVPCEPMLLGTLRCWRSAESPDQLLGPLVDAFQRAGLHPISASCFPPERAPDSKRVGGCFVQVHDRTWTLHLNVVLASAGAPHGSTIELVVGQGD